MRVYVTRTQRFCARSMSLDCAVVRPLWHTAYELWHSGHRHDAIRRTSEVLTDILAKLQIENELAIRGAKKMGGARIYVCACSRSEADEMKVVQNAGSRKNRQAEAE
jgi:hypothetical protein